MTTHRIDNPAGAPAGSSTADARGPLLQVRDLEVEFRQKDRVVKAVNQVSLEVHRGEALGILGESGSGKSVTARALLRILRTPPAHVSSGTALLDGVDLLAMDEATRQKVVGSRIAMVFQDALSALNPVHRVGRQIAEMYTVHRGMGRREARQEAIRMMRAVRIPDAERRHKDYPHQFSGGMRQRVVIAMALSLDPDLLIADEPTTALDVTVQEQILALLREQREQRGMGLVLITHDVSVVGENTDRVAVMYAGRVVETGPTQQVLASPRHPYTLGLARSSRAEPGRGRLRAIPGSPPDLADLPPGCPFAPRCEYATSICTEQRPELRESAPGQLSACHHDQEVPAP